jgi:hypothetical protein
VIVGPEPITMTMPAIVGTWPAPGPSTRIAPAVTVRSMCARLDGVLAELRALRAGGAPPGQEVPDGRR